MTIEHREVDNPAFGICAMLERKEIKTKEEHKNMPISAIEKTYPDVHPGPDEPFVHQDFPQMIYHYIKAAIVVTNEEDLKKYLSEGWSKSPVEMNELAALDAKIAETEGVLKQLKTNRKEMFAQKQREKGFKDRT